MDFVLEMFNAFQEHHALTISVSQPSQLLENVTMLQQNVDLELDVSLENALSTELLPLEPISISHLRMNKLLVAI